jgi:hypothetical protein
MSEEGRLNMNLDKKGVPLSKEHKQKLSISNKGKKHKKRTKEEGI